MNPADFGKTISELDIRLFSKIESQTTADDRIALLAIERAVRTSGDYVYLEIGSFLGGTLQPHLLDPRCTKIFSIDRRPDITNDVRGEAQIYQNNSTEKMLELLSGISNLGIRKIVTFDSDAADLDVSAIDPKPSLCFIDGEHTNEAAMSDFEFCLRVASPDCTIVFHDSNLVFEGIRRNIDKLRQSSVEHTAMKLGGSVFAIALGRSPIISDKYIVSTTRNLNLFFLKSTVHLWHRRNRIRRKNAKRSGSQ